MNKDIKEKFDFNNTHELYKKLRKMTPFYLDFYFYFNKDKDSIENFYLDSLDRALKEFEKATSAGKMVYIPLSMDQFCNKDYMTLIAKNFQNKKVVIVISDGTTKGLENKGILNNNTLNNLIESYQYLSENGMQNIIYEDGMSIGNVINANLKLQSWADEINNTLIDGKPLSPLEKYVYAYQIVTAFKYKESNKNHPEDARQLTKILNSDGRNIVCAGYAQLLAELCQRIGIPCTTLVLNPTDASKFGHSSNMLYLIDEKYNINGLYFADPTYDSSKNGVSHTKFGLMTYQEAVQEYQRQNLGIINIDTSYESLKTLTTSMRKLKLPNTQYNYLLDTQLALNNHDYYTYQRQQKNVRDIISLCEADMAVCDVRLEQHQKVASTDIENE